MAQIIDPWSGFNQGIQNLNQSLSDIRRQKAEDLELESRGIQNQSARAQLQDLLLKQSQNQELRDAMAGAKPETVTNTQFIPSQVSPSIDILNRMPGQQPAPSLSTTPAQNPSVFNTPGEIKTTSYMKQVDPAMVAYSTLMAQGRFQEADAVLAAAKNNAQLKGEMDAVGSTDLADYFTKQAKLAMTKTQSDMLDKGFTAIANLMDKGGISAIAQFQGQIKQIPGFENFDSSKMIADNTNRFMSYDAGNGFSVIVDKERPKEFKIEPMTDISLFMKGYLQEHPQATIADVQKAYRADQLEKFKAQRMTVVNNPMPSRAGGLQATYGISDADAAILARGIEEGRIDPTRINSRTAKVYVQMEKASGGDTNYVGAGANVKYKTSAQNLQSRALMEGIQPLYDKLLAAGKALGNSEIMGVNRIVNWAKEQTGNPEIVGFNNLRDDVIAESERVLMGSGVLSDSKYLRAVKNVNSAQSYPQLQAAVKNLRTVIATRLDALNVQPFETKGGSNKPLASGTTTKVGKYTVTVH